MITLENARFIAEWLQKVSLPPEPSLICLGYPNSTAKEDKFFERFSALFSSTTILDAIAHTGIERIVDLNEWVPDIAADVVLDSGTLEHCFNIGRAFRSAAEMVNPGGLLFLTGPLYMLNHGYWTYNPCALFDGLGCNGFEILEYKAVPFQREYSVKITEQRDLLPTQEFAQLAVAKRVWQDEKWNWPIQGKYKS